MDDEPPRTVEQLRDTYLDAAFISRAAAQAWLVVNVPPAMQRSFVGVAIAGIDQRLWRASDGYAQLRLKKDALMDLGWHHRPAEPPAE